MPKKKEFWITVFRPDQKGADVRQLDFDPTSEDDGAVSKTLAYFQELIGGYIESVRCADPITKQPCIMLVDEDGMAKGLPFNQHVSRRYYPGNIVGTAVILEGFDLA